MSSLKTDSVVRVFLRNFCDLSLALALDFSQIFGYAWPAYQSYKAIQAKNSEAIREWCIYWFIMALFMLAERVLDMVVFWIPLYYEAKLVFVVWLWHPQSKGAVSLYAKTIQPLLSQYESEIDRFVAEARSIGSEAISKNIGRVMAWLQDKAAIAFTRMQDMQQKHPQQRGARRTADGYYGGNGQGSSPSTPSTDNIWTSSRRTAEAAMNAFSRTKHD